MNKLCRCHRLHGAHLAVCNGELLLVVLYWGSHPWPAEVYKPVWTPNRWCRVSPGRTDIITVRDKHTIQVVNILSLFNVSINEHYRGYL